MLKIHAVIGAILWVGLGMAISQHASPAFEMPLLKLDSDDRVFAKLPWVTTKWDPNADEPFLEVQKEINGFRTFQGFDSSGKWAAKATRAYDDWVKDCQDPVKLFRASAYFNVVNEVDSAASNSARFKSMWEKLHLGWYIIKNPPKSYWFVRQGYKSCAGDGDRHLFGDLAKAFLKKNPLDRSVFRCGVLELWDEMPRWKVKAKKATQIEGKGMEFEEFLIEAGLRIRKTDSWRPWDDAMMMKLYLGRAMRTKRRKAVEYNESAIAKVPKGFDKTFLLANRDSLTRAKAMMTKD